MRGQNSKQRTFEVQLELPLFDDEIVDQPFEFYTRSKSKIATWETPVLYDVYIRRREAISLSGRHKLKPLFSTLVHIHVYNYLGRSGNTFIVLTTGKKSANPRNISLPKLNDLSKERLLEFVEGFMRFQLSDQKQIDTIDKTCADQN